MFCIIIIIIKILHNKSFETVKKGSRLLPDINKRTELYVNEMQT